MIRRGEIALGTQRALLGILIGSACDQVFTPVVLKCTDKGDQQFFLTGVYQGAKIGLAIAVAFINAGLTLAVVLQISNSRSRGLSSLF